MISSYYYDPFGRRLWKEVSGVRTYYHYSDEGLIGEYDASGLEIKTYGYKPGSTWTTDPLFMKVGTEYYFYHNDHLGTPQKMTAVNGAVVWSAKYSSFGKAMVEVEAVTNNLRFPGQYYDAETGNHYNFWRYYDSNGGRYITIDPIGFGGGINFYVYASNDPLGLLDPEGLSSHGKGNKMPTELEGFNTEEQVDEYLKNRYPDDPKKRKDLKKKWEKSKGKRKSRQKKDKKKKKSSNKCEEYDPDGFFFPPPMISPYPRRPSGPGGSPWSHQLIPGLN